MVFVMPAFSLLITMDRRRNAGHDGNVYHTIRNDFDVRGYNLNDGL